MLCCKTMDLHLNKEDYEEDVVVICYDDNKKIGIPNQHYENGICEIEFCPWCGCRLSSRRSY